ncbi:MAG: LysR family transcriptional regulator [Planctomycetales bacterium]|nr:LysR family transcriptional regulator [Planctomycetales bacterium]
MELQQLRYFVAAADLRNFTRAAERCGVAQPSLSQQIAKLEQSLGKTLLDRSGRRVALTDAGEEFYERAVKILSLVDEAERVGSGAVERPRLRVGAIPTIAPYLLPPVLKEFSAKNAAAEVSVVEDLTAEIVSGCIAGDLDVGIVALPIDDAPLHVEQLFREELLVALPARHPLAKKNRVTAAELAREPFVLLSEAHCLGEQIVSYCRQRECPPRVHCRSGQLLTVQELVGLGYGLSFVPEMARATDRSKLRVYRSLAGAKPMRTVAMIWHRFRVQQPTVAAFRETLKKSRTTSVANEK